MKYIDFKKLIAVGLISAQVFAFGCTQPNSGTTEISGQDLIEVAEQAEEERIEVVRMTLKEEFDKHFKNGLYFEDFTDVKERLDAEFIAYMEKEVKECVNYPLFVQSDIEYLNASLKKAREENWGIEKFLNDNEMHIRNMEVNVYVFVENEERSSFSKNLDPYYDYASLFTKYHNRFADGRARINFRYYNSKILDSETIQELKDKEKPWFYLHKYSEVLANENYGYMTIAKVFNKWEEGLRKKYNEEFIVLPYKSFLAPKNDLSIRFKIGGGDKYLTALSQKLITDEINKIIEEEGASDHLVHITTPKGNVNHEQDRITVDTGEITNVKQFLNQSYEKTYSTTLNKYGELREPFEWKFDTAMIYLTLPGEEPDYEELLRVHHRIAEIINRDRLITHNRFVFFYNVDTEEDKQIITELIRRDQLTEYFFRKNHGLDEAFSKMYVTRADIDGFDYLDIYGREYGYILDVVVDPDVDLTPEEFEKIYKSKDMFGGR